MKSRDNILKEELSESSDSDFELAEDWVLSYEPVQLVSFFLNLNSYRRFNSKQSAKAHICLSLAVDLTVSYLIQIQ